MAFKEAEVKVKNIHVAVVEDNSEIRQGVSFIINNTDGYSCMAFPNAELAVEKISEKLPDVVLMDINLPGMNGIECTKILKEKYPELLVMICSVYDDDDNIFKALEAGASGYILKSAAGNKLIDSIQELTNGGSPMSSTIARKVVAKFHNSNALQSITTTQKDYSLTARENEILDLLAKGFRNKEIAEKLFVSVNTIRTHVYNIYEKLHVNSRIEALNKTGRGYN